MATTTKNPSAASAPRRRPTLPMVTGGSLVLPGHHHAEDHQGDHAADVGEDLHAGEEWRTEERIEHRGPEERGREPEDGPHQVPAGDDPERGDADEHEREQSGAQLVDHEPPSPVGVDGVPGLAGSAGVDGAAEGGVATRSAVSADVPAAAVDRAALRRWSAGVPGGAGLGRRSGALAAPAAGGAAPVPGGLSPAGDARRSRSGSGAHSSSVPAGLAAGDAPALAAPAAGGAALVPAVPPGPVATLRRPPLRRRRLPPGSPRPRPHSRRADAAAPAARPAAPRHSLPRSDWPRTPPAGRSSSTRAPQRPRASPRRAASAPPASRSAASHRPRPGASTSRWRRASPW